MTSPFVDRVEFQVVGRDQGASRVFRNVANEADRAGDEIDALSGGMNRLSADIDDASGRLRAMLLALQAISNVNLPDLAIGDVDTGNIQNLDDLFAAMADEIERSSRASTVLRSNLATVDDSGAIAGVAGDVQALTSDVDGASAGIIRFRDELDRLDGSTSLSRLSDQFRNFGSNRSQPTIIDGEVVRDQVERTVRTISSNRDRFERAGLVAGGAAGAGFLAGMSDVLSNGIGGILLGGLEIVPLAAALGPPIAFAGGALATMFVTAFGGALLGGLGIAGIVPGLIMASKNDQVKKAATETGVVIMDQMLKATAKFPPAVTDALSIVRAEVVRMGPELKQFFDVASTWVAPLTRGLMGAFREALPGLSTAMREMQPVIDELVRWLPKLGKLVGDIFARLADEAPAMARALGLTIGLLTEVAKAMTGLILIATQMFKVVDIAFSLLTGNIGAAAEKIAFYNREQQVVVANGPEVKVGMEQVRDAFGGVGKIAEMAAGQINRLTQAQLEQINVANAHINQGNAVGAMYDAIRRAAEIAKNKGIDPATEAGEANRRKLYELAAAANNAAIRMDENGATHAEVAREMKTAQEAFLRAALAAGVEEAQAIDLMRALFAIPGEVNTFADFNETQAMKDAKALKRALDGLDGRTVQIRAQIRLTGDLLSVMPYGSILDAIADAYSKGGPVRGPGLKGVDSKLALVAPGEHVFTAQEVDAAGGHGNLIKLRQSLLNGHGATVDGGGSGGAMPGRRGGGGRPTGGINPAVLAEAVRRALSGVTLKIDDRTARTAQLVARGG